MSAPLRYAPELRLSLGGRPVPSALRGSISSVSCQNGLDGADRVEVALANPGLRWLDHDLLRLDTEMRLEAGYAPGPLTTLFVGDIVGQTPTFPASAMPALTVVAQDRRTKLQRSGGTRWFAIPTKAWGVLPLPDTAVATTVALPHGLIPITDPVGAVIATVLQGVETFAAIGDPDAMQKVVRRQHGESDHAFLQRLAKESGLEMLIDHEAPPGGLALRFLSPAGRVKPDAVLSYGRDLIDFSPRLTNVGQIGGVTVKVWEPNSKLEVAITVSWDWDRMALDISVAPGVGLNAMGASSDKKAVSVVREPVSIASAPRMLISKLLPRLNDRLTASGSTIGDPRIRAGGIVQIEGVGEQFGGRYRVTSVTHSIDGSGFLTRFQARKEIWFGSIPPVEQGAVRVNGMTGLSVGA